MRTGSNNKQIHPVKSLTNITFSPLFFRFIPCQERQFRASIFYIGYIDFDYIFKINLESVYKVYYICGVIEKRNETK
ncbi:hypothetical protein UNH65_29185 [Chitinophaga sp. 180180018-2]|nr:hypothetical protein [Chitinophaga sp. 212800010-3]